ncbi:MAG: DNA-processing protein DprA [Erysipelotrichaceae bacterium]
MTIKREQLLYYSIKYFGDYFKILKAISNNENYYNVDYSVKYITIVDKDYPDNLRLLQYPPFVLYYKGDINILKYRGVSVVGSRICCDYSKDYALNMAKYLNDDIVIISGLAMGIDAYAHTSAIKYGNKTIGVIGCGLDVIYPIQNKDLYQIMFDNHLVISEYPLGVKPDKYHFPFRNRIIAALGNKMIVLCATLKSGTMHSVNYALELNKDVYCLPHKVDCQFGKGCNYLISCGAMIILDEKIE